ncbi:competence protein ComK [Niallia sp. XMNu-256]|uniref:competence protein ComK n=1 Tax=Niallia sp. XMNu-256 TaxID=3082444 RepID=UPI0030D35A41
MNNKYLINIRTSALISYFENGYEYTQVIEGENIFIVPQSPDEIVKTSFLHIGSTVEGAIESARLILKKKYMLPIGLSTSHNIFLIRCHARRKSETVWLVNSHIADVTPDPTDAKKTIVHTKHGHSLTIDIKLSLLQDKRGQASFLYNVLLERSPMKCSMTFLYEKDKGIHFVKGPERLNYTISREEKNNKE